MNTPSPRRFDPLANPGQAPSHLAGARPSPQKDGPGASLLILQTVFDDEAAHRTAADLRAQVREDLRWGPVALIALFILTAALAALSRGGFPL